MCWVTILVSNLYTDMAFDISKYLPGFKGNTAAAEQNIGQQLSGMPSTAPARAKAAYFGATSGLPNSGVSNAVGYDLYGEDAAREKQSGFDNLLKLITGYSGNAFTTPGQEMQGDQFNRDLANRNQQAAIGRGMDWYDKEQKNKPRLRSGFKMIGNRGPVPGGFTDREWWA